ncbi:hypothetical protein Pcinc_028519 [Petrolisthes cinctipes]|uniref:Uncharacterized protein n=2 Tax=Petrolisthes cinctipes TaxID=88211 RepID=A0AAE1F285_PETCI|nr:hypothetical protein Pcinc_028519 [Petrolisthes cinctipes]
MKTKSVKERAKAALDALRARRVKALKTPFGKKSLIQENNGLPSFSDNVLLKSHEFMHSITMLTNEVSNRLSLEINKFSLKSFERILENSAVLANTKTTLRNMENRLQAAVAELRQFRYIRDEGLTTTRKVISNVASKLCTLEPLTGKSWIEDDMFIKFAVETELFNIKESKKNITMVLKGVHEQHVALLDMINSAISSGTELGGGGGDAIISSLSEREDKMMKVSSCGKYVIHPTTGILVKIKKGDIGSSCGEGVEAVHRQVALKVLERIDRNKNNMLRARLYAMRKGRGDLRDIVSFDKEDVIKTDALVKALGAALANSAAASTTSLQQPSATAANNIPINAFSSNILPVRKSVSYIPVAVENKHSPSSSPAGCRQSHPMAAYSSMLADANSETSYRFLDQQEAHDLASIINIHSKHRMGEYNQSSILSLFNRSQKARAAVGFSDNIEATPLKQLFDNISQNTSAVTVPKSAVPSSTANTRVTEYVARMSTELSTTPEYAELSKIYDDMASTLSLSSSLRSRQSLTNPTDVGYLPKPDYDTITAVSEMKQLKTTTIDRFVKILTTLENYVNDPSLASSSRLNSPPIMSTIENGALDSAIVSSGVGGSISPSSVSSVYNRLEASFKDGSSKELINKETDVRLSLLMHYEPFLNKIQRVFDMITDYFKNVESIRTIFKKEVTQVVADQTRKIESFFNQSEQNLHPGFERGVELHKDEINAITTEISVIKTKIVEIESTHDKYASILESLSDKFNTGTNVAPIGELIRVAEASQQEIRMIEDLKDFARDHSGVVFSPTKETFNSDSESLKVVKREIEEGQERIKVSYDEVLSKAPSVLQESFGTTEDIKLFMNSLRNTFTTLGDFNMALKARITALEERSLVSGANVQSIRGRIESGRILIQDQLSEQKDTLEKQVEIAVNAVNHALSSEIVQIDILNYIVIQVDKLLVNARRGITPATVNESSKSPPAAHLGRVPLVDSGGPALSGPPLYQ